MDINNPDIGGSTAADNQKEKPTCDGAGGGQDPQIGSHRLTGPSASGPRSWDEALWASPLTVEEQPATPGPEGGPATPAADPQARPTSPGAIAGHETTNLGTPLPRAGRPAGMAEADLMLLPPLDAARVMQLCNDLEQFACAKLVGGCGSWEEGAILKVTTNKLVSLLEVLHLMPEVAQAWEEPSPRPGIRDPLKGRTSGPSLTESDKRIYITLKDVSEPKQLAFNFGAAPSLET